MSATDVIDVRTGKSIWSDGFVRALPRSRLRRDSRTDVLVVGAGITGALVAEALADAGLRVTIVDKGPPLSGSTMASTALLQYELDVSLGRLRGKLGAERAVRIWRRSHLALDALRERTRRLGIDARCVSQDSLYLQGDILNAQELKYEVEARRAAGFEVEWLGRREVRSRYGIVGRAALRSFGGISADPRRLAAGYLRCAIANGARLHSPAHVEAVEPGSGEVQAAIKGGPVIRARYLVFATGYEIPHGVPRKGHRIASTWAMATRPQRGWKHGCLVWEASNPYLYLRPGPEGRIICGGEDEDFQSPEHRDRLTPGKIAALQRKLSRLIPHLDVRAEYSWAGSFGTSPTGSPSIGAVPGMAGCHAVLGYGGNGITFAMVAAQLLRTTITGGRDPDADLFSFRR